MISRLLLRPPRGPIWASLLAVVALIVFSQHTRAHGQRADEEIVTVATRPGVNQAFLLVRPPGLPVATVVVLVGGTGKLDLTPRALLHARGVFVPRRKQLAGQGLVVALIDAPSDRRAEGLLNFVAGRNQHRDGLGPERRGAPRVRSALHSPMGYFTLPMRAAT